MEAAIFGILLAFALIVASFSIFTKNYYVGIFSGALFLFVAALVLYSPLQQQVGSISSINTYVNGTTKVVENYAFFQFNKLMNWSMAVIVLLTGILVGLICTLKLMKKEVNQDEEQH